MKKLGFTLTELIIVIAIIGILVTLVAPNLTGGRERARDTAKKAELHAMRTSMNLYFNQFGRFPGSTNGMTLLGCGTTGTDSCLCTGNPDWVSGDQVFMTNFSCNNNQIPFRYYSSGTDYRLKINLENESDPDLEVSQQRCPPAYGPTSWGATDYVVCP